LAKHVLTLRVDPSVENCTEAIKAIAELREDGKAAVPVIAAYLNQRFASPKPGDSEVIEAGLSTLAQFAPEDSEARHMLVVVSESRNNRGPLLRAKDSGIRCRAIALLGDVGDHYR
jgi:hypothetical protein